MDRLKEASSHGHGKHCRNTLLTFSDGSNLWLNRCRGGYNASSIRWNLVINEMINLNLRVPYLCIDVPHVPQLYL